MRADVNNGAAACTREGQMEAGTPVGKALEVEGLPACLSAVLFLPAAALAAGTA